MLIENVLLLGTGDPVDVRVENGIVSEISPARGSIDSARGSIDLARREAPARVLLPGFLDMHTHLRQPGFEESETMRTGCEAAAAGGYTDVFAMANTSPVTDSVERVEAIRGLAAGAAASVHAVSAATRGLGGEQLVDVAALRRAGVILFSDDGKWV